AGGVHRRVATARQVALNRPDPWQVSRNTSGGVASPNRKVAASASPAAAMPTTFPPRANVAELVDAPDLGSGASRRGSSSLPVRIPAQGGQWWIAPPAPVSFPWIWRLTRALRRRAAGYDGGFFRIPTR